MTKYVDILLWTAKQLKTNFPTYNIYVDSNEEQIIKPSFFIEVVPMGVDETMDTWQHKTVNLLIEYVNLEAMAQDKLQMVDDLNELISRQIYVENIDGSQRYLPVFAKKPTIQDAVTMLVTLEYYDIVASKHYSRAYDELMQIIALNTNYK